MQIKDRLHFLMLSLVNGGLAYYWFRANACDISIVSMVVIPIIYGSAFISIIAAWFVIKPPK